MSAGDRDTLAELLDEHREAVSEDGGLSEGCMCPNGPEFDWFPDRNEMHRRYVAHLSDVLLASDWLREQRTEAWDGGATHADREWQNSEYNNDGSTPGYEYWDTDVSANPYRRTTEDTDG